MKSAGAIFLAAVAGVDRSVLAVELGISLPGLPTIPPVQHPDKQGYPTITSLQSTMEGFTKERDTLNQDAAALGRHLKKVEKEGADRIVQQHTVYNEKLKEQEKKNQAVSVENAKVAHMVKKVRQGNDKLSALVQKEQNLVDVRRGQFSALKKKILEGEQRVNQLFEGSDRSAPMSFIEVVQEGARRKKMRNEAAELAVSSEFSEAPTSELEASSGVDEQVQMVQTQAEEIGAESSEKTEAISSPAETSFLKLEQSTDSQISFLSKQANKLNLETAHALAELKASFQENYKAGAKRYNALMQQQKVLKKTLQSSEETFSKLKAKLKRVTGIRQGLDQELQRNGVSLGESQKMESSTE